MNNISAKNLQLLPFLVLIRAYQILLAPLFIPTCRYYPSCSAYAEESLRKRGLWQGIALSFYRILRCNPFTRGGYDPVK